MYEMVFPILESAEDYEVLRSLQNAYFPDPFDVFTNRQKRSAEAVTHGGNDGHLLKVNPHEFMRYCLATGAHPNSDSLTAFVRNERSREGHDGT